nr:hypothetical protein [Rhodococcus sp. 14-1411-2a]
MVEDLPEGVGSAPGGAAIVLAAVGGGWGSVNGESAVSSFSPVTASKSPLSTSRPLRVVEAKSSLRSVFSAGGFLLPKLSSSLVIAARIRPVRASGPVAALIKAARAASRPFSGRCFGEGEDQGGVVDGHDAGVDGVGDVGKRSHAAGEGDDLGCFGR